MFSLTLKNLASSKATLVGLFSYICDFFGEGESESSSSDEISYSSATIWLSLTASGLSVAMSFLKI